MIAIRPAQPADAGAMMMACVFRGMSPATGTLRYARSFARFQ